MPTTLYIWVNGLSHKIPDYALIDLILAAYTLLHAFVAISIFTVSDAFYKKTLMKTHYKIAKTFHNMPLLVELMTLALTVQTACLCYLAACKNPHVIDEITLRAVISIYTWVCSIVLQRQSISLAKLGVNRTMEIEQEVEIYNISTWKPPHESILRFLLAPINFFLRPEAVGIEHISNETPGLYVSNHCLYGLEMAPLLNVVYRERKVFLRGLSDHFHFGQLHGEILRIFGAVDGSRKNVDCLMKTNQNVLVYPGGGHEVLKPSNVPRYTLMWKERLGFARMAIKHGYPIVPCCSVGTEDMMDTIIDIPVGFLRKDLQIPIISPILRLQKVYFWFGEPIPTDQYKGDYMNDEFAREVRDKVKTAIESGIQELKKKQENDPNRFLLDHAANSANNSMKMILDFCRKAFNMQSLYAQHTDDQLRSEKED